MNYQMFLYCEHHTKLKVFLCAACAAVAIILTVPLQHFQSLQTLLQPLISVGQFTCRNALSKSQAGLQLIFKKTLVFSASCNSQLPGNMAKRCCPQINQVTT